MDHTERMVVFAILMENNQGIVGKSPDYIEEKYNAAIYAPYPERLLDLVNRRKFQRWQERWERAGD